MERREQSLIQEGLEGLRKSRIVGVAGNIRSRHLPNAILEHRHDSNLLGPFASKKTPCSIKLLFFKLI